MTQPAENNLLASGCHLTISRGSQRPQAHLYAFNLCEAIPICPIPLQGDEAEAEPVLDLQNLLLTLYEQAGYDLRIDYRGEPVPPLARADTA